MNPSMLNYIFIALDYTVYYVKLKADKHSYMPKMPYFKQ